MDKDAAEYGLTGAFAYPRIDKIGKKAGKDFLHRLVSHALFRDLNGKEQMYIVASPEEALRGHYVTPISYDNRFSSNIYFPKYVTPVQRVNISDYRGEVPFRISKDEFLKRLHDIDSASASDTESLHNVRKNLWNELWKDAAIKRSDSAIFPIDKNGFRNVLDKLFSHPTSMSFTRSSNNENFHLHPNFEEYVNEIYNDINNRPFNMKEMLDDMLPKKSKYTGSDKLIKNIYKSMSKDYGDYCRQQNVTSGCLGDRL